MQKYVDIFGDWIVQNPLWGSIIILIASLIIYQIFRFFIGRVLVSITERTETEYDDMIVDSLRPFRVAWLAPLILIYLFSKFAFPDIPTVSNISLVFIIWVSTLSLTSMLDGVNTIYEYRPNYNGVSIQGYLDIVKILVYLVAIILSISVITGESPLILLSGIGALTAVLLLVFRDTILSVVASMQIAANDLVKEGDWIEVPSYGADGDVINISLHAIAVKNWDQTTTFIPTYKMVDTAFKNYRTMQLSGGRKIQRSIIIDIKSISFCSDELLNTLKEIDVIKPFVEEKISAINEYKKTHTGNIDWPLDGPHITNLEVFSEYIRAYIIARGDLHVDNFSFLVRDKAPTVTGLPVELYVFTKTTAWKDYEAIQSSIFNHIIAALPVFELRPFQEKSGYDIVTQ